MATQGYSPTWTRVQERRIDKAGAIIDRLDICRRLIDQFPTDNRLALARQLIRQTADDVAELVGIEDDPLERARERREAAAITRAVQP